MSATAPHTPSNQYRNAPLTPPSPAISVWWLALFVVVLSALLAYSPAFFNDSPQVNRHSLVSSVTGLTPTPTTDIFYSTWSVAASEVRDLRLPLLDTFAGQPLMEAAEIPTLYPLSILRYIIPDDKWGALLFGLVHLILLGMTLFGWGKAAGRRWEWWLPLTVAILPLIAVLRVDYVAGLVWVAIGLLLRHYRATFYAWLLLPIVMGLILLAAPLWFGVLLCLTLSVYWLAHRFERRGLANRLGLILLCAVGGFFIAAPQLFPQLTYNGAVYQPTRNQTTFSSQVENAELTRFERTPEAEYLLELAVPANTRELSLLLVNPADNGAAGTSSTGWTGQLRATGGSRGPEVKISGTSPTSSQQLAITFPADSSSKATNYSLRVRYNPLSYNLGLYAAFLSLISLALGVTKIGSVGASLELN